MHVLIVVALLGSVGLGFENDWAGVKAYKTLQECQEAHPHTPNTMTSWSYNECNFLAYKLQNK